MNSYKELDKNRYTYGKYSLVPLRYDDRFLIMKWRNEQIFHLRQDQPLTLESQESYFSTVVSQLFEQEKPNQLLFSYLENETCIGYGGLVHLNRKDRNAEISFIMNTRLENELFQSHWSTFLNLIEQVGFGNLQLHKMYTYAFDVRPYLYACLELEGYEKEAVLREHCLFEGEFKNVVIHSKINPDL